MKLTAHFDSSEFDCKDGTPVPEKWMDRVRMLAVQLEVLRAELGDKPIKITSGYRTPSYNRKVGGGKASQHLLCKAADIKAKGVSPAKVHETILRLIRESRILRGGVGLYDGRFCHYDIRGFNARWRG